MSAAKIPPASVAPRLKPCPDAANWQLQLQPSRIHGVIGGLSYASAGLLVLLLNTPIIWKLLLCCALIGLAMITWRKLLRALNLTAIRCINGKLEVCMTGTGVFIPAVFYGSQWVSPFVCILRLKLHHQHPLLLPLFYDCAPAEDLRKMRVFLNSHWYFITAQAPAPVLRRIIPSRLKGWAKQLRANDDSSA